MRFFFLICFNDGVRIEYEYEHNLRNENDFYWMTIAGVMFCQVFWCSQIIDYQIKRIKILEEIWWKKWISIGYQFGEKISDETIGN